MFLTLALPLYKDIDLDYGGDPAELPDLILKRIRSCGPAQFRQLYAELEEFEEDDIRTALLLLTQLGRLVCEPALCGDVYHFPGCTTGH